MTSKPPFWERFSKNIRPSSRHIGLDIGTRLIKVVQLNRDAGGWKLADVRVKAISIGTGDLTTNKQEHDLPEVLRRLIVDMGIEGAHVAISISGPSIIMKPLEIPWMSEDELAGHLEWEVERYLPYERDEVYWDYYVPQRHHLHPSSSMLVYLVAAKKDIVDQRVALVKRAGLRPVVVDIDCVALANMHELNGHGVVHVPGLVVNIGPSGLNIITVGDAEHFAMRDAALGGEWAQDLLQEESQYLNDGEAEVPQQVFEPMAQHEMLEEVYSEILYEVRRALDDCHSYEQSQMIQQIWLSGGYAHLPGLVAHLSSHLHVPVNIIDPFRSLKISAMASGNIVAPYSSLAAVAVGLAVRCNYQQ
ncbi:type IV pilus assembly protein PilM [Nitrospira sp. M1]